MRNEGFPHRFDAGALDHSELSKTSSAALRVSASCGGRASRVQRVAGLSFFGLLIWVGVHPGVLTPLSVRDRLYRSLSGQGMRLSGLPLCAAIAFSGGPGYAGVSPEVLQPSPLGTRRPKCHPAVVTGHITHGPLCLGTVAGKRSACGAN